MAGTPSLAVTLTNPPKHRDAPSVVVAVVCSLLIFLILHTIVAIAFIGSRVG